MLLCLLVLPGFVPWAEAAGPADGLIAYWSFDDSVNFAVPDSGGSTLSANGSPAWTASGKNGGGLSLNGSSSLRDLSSPAWIPVGNTHYSVAAWFKASNVARANGIIGWGQWGATNKVRALRTLGSAGGGFRLYWWGNDLDCSAGTCPITTNGWHHVAATWDGTTRKLYLDGVLKVQNTPAAGSASAINFNIGVTNNSEYFIGTLDDVAVYNRGISAAEVVDLVGGPPDAATTSTTTSTTTTTTSTTTTVPSTTTSSTTTVSPGTAPAPAPTTTAPPALEIVIQLPTTTTVPPTPQTSPSAVSDSPDGPTVLLPPVSPPGATAAPALRSVSGSTTSTVPPTSTTVPRGATTVPPPSIPRVVTGGAAVMTGGVRSEATVSREDNQIVVQSGGMRATFGNVNAAGEVLSLDPEGNIRLAAGSRIRIRASGFEPGSTVDGWLFSTPIKLGSSVVRADGTVDTTFVIPENAPAGAHRVAIEARTADGEKTSIAVGVMLGDFEKESNIATRLIVGALLLAIVLAFLLPAVSRRRPRETD